MATATDLPDAPATPPPGAPPALGTTAAPNAPAAPAASPQPLADPEAVAADAKAEATRLVATLAAHAVRRDPRALHRPLDEVAPWARALPPAAWRTFAAEVTVALGTEQVTGQDGPHEALEQALDRWAAVAARFAETPARPGPGRR